MEYITGNKFKSFCHYFFDGSRLIRNKNREEETLRIFVKTDWIDLFFRSITIQCPFIIFTHNSDYSINSRHLKYLELPNIVSWYGQNIEIIHPKLKSIPIGIANEEWPHGDIKTLELIRLQENQKRNLIYANFNINTNVYERTRCLKSLESQNIKVSPVISFDKYLLNLSQSYFSISPNGNGIDCHKTWESLYLKTVPIITKSNNSIQYKNLPVVIIDSWEKFSISDFSFDLYSLLWYNFRIKSLSFSHYVSSVLHSQKIPT